VVALNSDTVALVADNSLSLGYLWDRTGRSLPQLATRCGHESQYQQLPTFIVAALIAALLSRPLD
jgi:hypothetical protein